MGLSGDARDATVGTRIAKPYRGGKPVGCHKTEGDPNDGLRRDAWFHHAHRGNECSRRL
ncbi:hypothetical protein CHELA1G11_10815 [Hyphomicrobiales bacterium]|nr:hypothetical protein CHELA1G11_10815 [Hyphomicrobiales bacterium]CAH1672082.1 hypothetical protein CHELA1G2_13495 [Hyphomicrobiales bacterium]